MNLIALLDNEVGEVHTLLAREVLQQAAEAVGVTITIDIIEPDAKARLALEQDKNTIVLLVSNNENWQSDTYQRYQGNLQRITYEKLLANPAAIFENMPKNSDAQNVPLATDGKKRIVAITSCPTGIAHTFMAAEGLAEAAKKLGYDIRVETQGSVGAGTPLTAKEIAEADIVIIAADREVDRTRFSGKRVFTSGTKPAINDGVALIGKALEKAEVQRNNSQEANAASESIGSAGGVYKHLMTGVSFMLLVRKADLP